MNSLRWRVAALTAGIALLALGAKAADPAEQEAAGNRDAAALLEKTGIKGGLCLVVGARDMALPVALAGQSALYVQALQPDAKLAAAWGLAVATSTKRESIGVRDAAFDPSHYGSCLFNLIVIADASGLGQAKLAEICRILVPNGCVALKSAPESFAAEAKDLQMDSLAPGSFQAIFKKPVLPVEWKPPLSLKWSAGPKGGFNSSYASLTSGSGKFFYRERMEVEGSLGSRSQLFARDADNGRTLWTLEEPAGWNPNWYGPETGGLWGLKADNKGRLLAATSDGKFVCLDAGTGKLRFELMEKGAGPASIAVYNDEYVIAYGKVFSAENGKVLWSLPRMPGLPQFSMGNQWAVLKDAMYICDGKTLTARKLADGQVLKSVELAGLPPRQYRGISFFDNTLILYTDGPVSALDSSSGRLLWTHAWSYERGERCMQAGDKLVFVVHKNTGPNGSQAEIFVTRVDLATGRSEVEKHRFDLKAYYGCPDSRTYPLSLGDYLVYPDVHIHTKTLELIPCGLPHVACAIGLIPYRDRGLIFNVPSRKSGPITAVGPADITLTNEPGWKRLQKFGQATSSEPTKEGDWPMFRGSYARGNSVKATLGDKLSKAWELQVGMGGKSFGVMCGQRTGLTQPVAAYGLVVVSDIEGQRIVAIGADSKTKWVFHVGSRVEFSPTLYNGLCLFAAKDGWVYCLDARTGALVWKNLVPAVERYIGGHEQLESIRPPSLNVAVADGLGYVDSVVFKPETGELEPAPKKAPGGRRLRANSGMPLQELVELGNSIPRTHEDNGGEKFTDGRAEGRVVAFDDTLSVAYHFWGAGERWDNKGPLNLMAVKDNPKAPLWKSPDIELAVDDIVLTPQFIYCVGHYQRIQKNPELWVVSREDGNVVNTLPVDGFPAFLGMSVAGNRLFVATREGKLICFENATETKQDM